MSVETADKLLLSVKDLCLTLNISRSSFFGLKSAGRIGPQPVRLNRKQLYLHSEVVSWLATKDARTGLLPTCQQWIELLESRK
jgi:predicted DNA-binding transcriptional regulator AlpA